MNPRALAALCLRPALAVTLLLLAALALGLGWVDSTVHDFAGPNGTLIFGLAYNVLTAALLVSLGGFVSKTTSALESVRPAWIVPGLRRQVTAGVVLIVPLAATVAFGYLAWAVPEQVRAVPVAAQWSAGAFLFCLGLAFGGSWRLVAAVVMLASQYRFIGQHLRETPIAFSAIALAAAAALIAVWHVFFLPARSARFDRRSWVARRGVNRDDALARRTGERLPDVADVRPHARTSLAGLLQAGNHERFGDRHGGLSGRIAVWVLGSYALFLGLGFAFARKSGVPAWHDFGARVFLSAQADIWVTLARTSFAVITGMAAYIAAVTFDSSLRPDLWHPVSRRRQARVAFWARVRQNATFAVFHLVVAAVLIASFAASARQWPAIAALRAFLLPPLFAGLLAPIVQALFPRGASTFEGKANPLVQLVAGLTGGAFCLAVVQGTAHWPTKALQAQLSEPVQIASFVGAVVLAYIGYWQWIRSRFAAADISRRQR